MAINLSDDDDRFWASLVLDLPNYDCQLRAIRDLLRLHGQDNEAHANEIKKIELFIPQASGSACERAIDDWCDLLHRSGFQDAAHSMAAVGMLAPFIESLFKRAFPGIRDHFSRNRKVLAAHKRWDMPEGQQWDCSKPGLVADIVQLANATGLVTDLPDDLEKTLASLFQYRNKMFHLGFEWPDKELGDFKNEIKKQGWPEDWFYEATIDDKPWMFYLNDSFVQHCLATIDQTLAGLGKFLRRNGELIEVEPSSQSQGTPNTRQPCATTLNQLNRSGIELNNAATPAHPWQAPFAPVSPTGGEGALSLCAYSTG